MKKIIAVLCVLVLLICTLSVGVIAANDTTPVVICQGYGGPSLVNTDTGEQVWGLDFDKVGEEIKAKLPEIAGTSGATFTGDYSQLVDILGGVLLDTLEPIKCNPDGTSKYNVTYTPQGAAATRVSTLKAAGENIAEKELVEILGEERGYDNIFIFTYDWRMGQIDFANAIDAYVQEVKALTGSSQIDIFGLSHGGQCVASYLYYYGTNGDVRKACMNVPAIGGTTMVGDPMTGKPINLDYATIMEFVEIGQGSEDEWEWLIKYIGFDHLNEVVTELCQRYIVDYIQYFGSIWDFVPLDVFEEALSYTKLNASENGELFRKTVEYHYDAMAHMSEGLQAAKDAGVTIAIMTNYGHENVTGSNKNSDYIIDTATSSGAYCAPFDAKFDDDYIGSIENCSNSSHYHISPERNIDAGCAYLPDNTWFINGQFHGMYVFDPNTKAFIQEFFEGNSIKNVFSNSQYPQFMHAQNAADGLYVQFNNTASGFHSAEDTKLILKNISSQYDIKIRYIYVNGSEIKLSYDTQKKIAAGKQAEISFDSYSLESDSKPFSINVIYTLYNQQNLLQNKSFEFTPLSEAEAKKYDYLVTSLPVSDNIIDLTAGGGNVTTTQVELTTNETKTEQSNSTGGTVETNKVNNPKTGSAAGRTTSIAGVCAAALAVTVFAVKKRKEK